MKLPSYNRDFKLGTGGVTGMGNSHMQPTSMPGRVQKDGNSGTPNANGANTLFLNFQKTLKFNGDFCLNTMRSPAPLPTRLGLLLNLGLRALSLALALALAALPAIAQTTPASGIASARLINISTRAQVGTGGNILITGFVIEGSGTEKLLIRADGPSLFVWGVAGVLAQPSLKVCDSVGNVIASNTGWTTENPILIASTANLVGAFPLPPGSADCALIVNLPAGAYTVQISGVNNTTGIVLAEVYEVSSTGTRLINISTRAQTGIGADILTSGFVIAGTGGVQLLVRADGPALSQFDVIGFQAQPSLSIFNSAGAVIASNTGWGTNADPAQVSSTATIVGAFPLSSGSADSAEIVTLPSGVYTVEISGANSATGVALAEVFEVP